MTATGMQVTAIAWTHFDQSMANALAEGWDTDAEGGQALAEFAGRACYQSWSKPNPATASNAGYLRHILEVGHLSVLEHGTVTMYMTGVSRSFTHELVRHRHFSYSQLSQRYVASGDAPVVEPDVIAADPYLHGVFTEAIEGAQRGYRELLHAMERRPRQLPCPQCGEPAKLENDPVQYWCTGCKSGFCPPGQITAIRKAARQAARSVLPNATETRIVVTGNYRAWRHFLAMRATAAADVEIRAAAIACYAELLRIAPNVFCDFELVQLDDDTWALRSPHNGES